MKTFLRKIRRSLIESGSTRRYILYAIGEIALVVIGILIALQINNWNEEKNRQREIGNYLANMAKDLEDDLAELKQSRDINIFRFHSMQYILSTAGASPLRLHENEAMLPYDEEIYIWPKEIPSEYNKEFIDLAFKWSHRHSPPVLNTSTIDELKNAGLFSHIQNRSLKDAINYYYAEYTWRLGGLVTSGIHDDWQNALLERGYYSHDMYAFEDPLTIFRTDPPLVAYAKALIRDARWRAISGDALAHSVIDIIDLINTELESGK